jgi:hypothetical protein
MTSHFNKHKRWRELSILSTITPLCHIEVYLSVRRLINHVYVCKWNRIYNFTGGVYSMCLRLQKIIKTRRTYSHSNTCTCNLGLSRLEHFLLLLLFFFTLFGFPMFRLNVVRPKLELYLHTFLSKIHFDLLGFFTTLYTKVYV